jgi:hypothetical protein
VPFDVRVIAATSRDLRAGARGQLPRRPVLPPERAAVRVPPLRERRRGDIPQRALAEVLLASPGADIRELPWRMRPAAARDPAGAEPGSGPMRWPCWRAGGRTAAAIAAAGAATSASCATCWSRPPCVTRSDPSSLYSKTGPLEAYGKQTIAPAS